MELSHQRTIYPCKEFDPVEVPLDQIVSNGVIQLYPEAEKYFDLDYRGGKLVVAPKSYIGLIPLNARTAINVRPRFPIDNVLYLIKKASATFRFIDGHLRNYGVTEEAGFDPVADFAQKFAVSCESLLKTGLLKKYAPAKLQSPYSGTLDMSETIIRYRTQGISYMQHWTSDELTDDIPENRLVRSAIVRVIGFLLEKNDKSSKKTVAILRQIYREFDNVGEDPIDSSLTEGKVAGYIKALPYHHRNYSQLIWLAFLIVTQRGLLIDSVGSVSFDTFVVNLADIFEDYVRNIISDYFYLQNGGFSVKDGNKEQVPLFKNNNTYKVKPDVYILQNKEPLAVIDAKYKPSIKPADRYEVISFCEALQVKRAIVVSPKLDDNRSELLGKTPSGIEFWHVKISLGSDKIIEEENDFLKCVAALVLPSPKDNL